MPRAFSIGATSPQLDRKVEYAYRPSSFGTGLHSAGNTKNGVMKIMSHITVKVSKPVDKDAHTGRVLVWERDNQHPNGEIFIAESDDKPMKVGRSNRIQKLINEGRLVEVGGKKAKAEAAADPVQDITGLRDSGYASQTVKDLRALLEARGESTEGKKADLVARLEATDPGLSVLGGEAGGE